MNSRQSCPHRVQCTLQLPPSTAITMGQSQGSVVITLFSANF